MVLKNVFLTGQTGITTMDMDKRDPLQMEREILSAYDHSRAHKLRESLGKNQELSEALNKMDETYIALKKQHEAYMLLKEVYEATEKELSDQFMKDNPDPDHIAKIREKIYPWVTSPGISIGLGGWTTGTSTISGYSPSYYGGK